MLLLADYNMSPILAMLLLTDYYTSSYTGHAAPGRLLHVFLHWPCCSWQITTCLPTLAMLLLTDYYMSSYTGHAAPYRLLHVFLYWPQKTNNIITFLSVMDLIYKAPLL